MSRIEHAPSTSNFPQSRGRAASLFRLTALSVVLGLAAALSACRDAAKAPAGPSGQPTSRPASRGK